MLCALIVERLPFDLANLRDGMTNEEDIERAHRTANLELSRYLSGAILAEISEEELRTTTIKDLLIDSAKKRAYIILDTQQKSN